MTELVTVNSLRNEYGSREVLKGINLKIYPGEVLGFVGRNGAGKSTFIHTITGITHKSSGDFKIFGHSNEITTNVKSKLGVMPDVSNLYDHMKGIAFLKYMGELAGDKRKKKDYERLFIEVGLEGAENKRIKSYSFGMKKKICIAQALLGNPQLIILDEPTSGVDPESAIKIRELILKLKNDNAIEFLIRTKPQLLKEQVVKLIDNYGFPVSFIRSNKNYTHLTTENEEAIPDLTEKLISDGISIYELKIKEQSLEEIFMTV